MRVLTLCVQMSMASSSSSAAAADEMSSSDSECDEPCPEALARYLNIRRNTVSLGDPRHATLGGAGVGGGGAHPNLLGADMHTPPPTFTPHPAG